MTQSPEWTSVVDVLMFGASREAPDSASRADLVQGEVLRRLNHLLNTRRAGALERNTRWLARRSIANYGIADFSGAGFNTSLGREQLRQDILAAVAAFEPRLVAPDVYDLNRGVALSRELRYRIDAKLRVYPRPQRVEYDSRFDCATQLFIVDDS